MEKKDFDGIVLQICAEITGGDPDVAAEMKERMENPESFINSHLESYSERSMNLEDDSLEDLIWLGMADCLAAHGYAAAVEWNATAAEFGWGISSLRSFKQLELPLDEKFLNEESSLESDDFASGDDDDDEYDYEREEESFEEQDVPYWCKCLDSQWFDEDACLGQIDAGTDAYVLFITSPDALEELEDLADKINRRITSVF